MRLNLFDYRLSAEIAARDEPVAALVAAAMRRADTDNMGILTGAFPGIAADLKARYAAPGGALPEEAPPPLTDSTSVLWIDPGSWHVTPFHSLAMPDRKTVRWDHDRHTYVGGYDY